MKNFIPNCNSNVNIDLKNKYIDEKSELNTNNYTIHKEDYDPSINKDEFILISEGKNLASSIDSINLKKKDICEKLLDFKNILDSPISNFIETKNLNEIEALKIKKKKKKINSESNLIKITKNEKSEINSIKYNNLNYTNNLVNSDKISNRILSKKDFLTKPHQSNSYFNQYIMSNNNHNLNKKTKISKNQKLLNNEMNDFLEFKTIEENLNNQD